MSLFSTLVSGKVKSIQREQHWQAEAQLMVRPNQIKMKVAEQLNAMDNVLAADKNLKARFDKIVLTMPQE